MKSSSRLLLVRYLINKYSYQVILEAKWVAMFLRYRGTTTVVLFSTTGSSDTQNVFRGLSSLANLSNHLGAPFYEHSYFVSSEKIGRDEWIMIAIN